MTENSEEKNPTQENQTTANKGLSAGEKLKQARQEQGLSIESVHEATNIPLDSLRAIEEGYTVRTLSAFYLKGFIKIYAKYLDIDVNQLIDGHTEVRAYKYIKPKKKTTGFNEVLANVFTKEFKQKIVLVLGALLVLFLLFKMAAFILGFFGDDKSTESKKVTAAAANKPQVRIQPEKKMPTIKPPVKASDKKEVVAVNDKPVSPLSSTVQKVPTQKTVSRNVTLTVRAKKEGWLRVASDGAVVYQSVLPLGAVETWMADDQIEISGRNINELEFELNGKMIGSLGRADRKAKKLIVTKDGLTVTK